MNSKKIEFITYYVLSVRFYVVVLRLFTYTKNLIPKT